MYKQDTWAYQKSGVIFYLSKIQEESPILLGDVDAGRTIPGIWIFPVKHLIGLPCSTWYFRWNTAPLDPRILMDFALMSKPRRTVRQGNSIGCKQSWFPAWMFLINSHIPIDDPLW